MFHFNSSQIKQLNDYLYNSDTHDAKIKSYTYDKKQKKLYMELDNSIFGVKINIEFDNVKVILLTHGDWIGDSETVNALTVEEDFSVIQNFMQTSDEELEKCLYLLFQTFSGDELHIVSREVCIDSIQL